MKHALFFVALQVKFIVLYSLFVEYGPFDARTPSGFVNHASDFYVMYSDVAVMVFVGFGFLMTFARNFRYSAVGLTFFVSVMVFQWSMLVIGFWEKVYAGEWEHKIQISIASLIDGMFCAASVMITMGAILGKTGPWQVMTLAWFETIIYGANYIIGTKWIGAVDIGGSMIIHTFGAYFGMAATFWFNPRPFKQYKALAMSYSSDLFAFIGTIWLWLMWPSFNAALAPLTSQFRVIINTLMSLSGCTFIVFCFSKILRPEHKFAMEDILNATLAGGVAIGSAADLVIGPGGAMATGCIAGLVCVLGYIYVTPFLTKRMNLHDTCGVQNLHGMSGIIAGVAGAIATGAADEALYGEHYLTVFPHTPDQQWKWQLACLGHTLGFAILGGFVFGLIVSKLKCLDAAKEDFFFSDEQFFEVPHKGEHKEENHGL